MEVSIKNVVGSHSYIDTRGAGSTIGTYSAMAAEDHIIHAHCKTSCTVLVLKYEVLEILREKHKSLDANLEKYEHYIDANGLPYCDYHLHRETDAYATPLQKFQQGIWRIIRITKAYRTNRIQDLLSIVQDQIKNAKRDRLRRKQKQIIKTMHRGENRTQELIVNMADQISKMNAKIDYLTQHIVNAALQPAIGVLSSKWLWLVFAIIGYLMIRFQYPRITFTIALVLGEVTERSFFQTMGVSDGSWAVFVTGAPAISLIALIVLTLLIPSFRNWLLNRKKSDGGQS